MYVCVRRQVQSRSDTTSIANVQGLRGQPWGWERDALDASSASEPLHAVFRGSFGKGIQCVVSSHAHLHGAWRGCQPDCRWEGMW